MIGAVVPVFFVLGVPACLIVVGIFVYGYACASRRTYACPHCGERVRTEYLEATRCNACGAALQEEEPQL